MPPVGRRHKLQDHKGADGDGHPTPDEQREQVLGNHGREIEEYNPQNKTPSPRDQLTSPQPMRIGVFAFKHVVPEAIATF